MCGNSVVPTNIALRTLKETSPSQVFGVTTLFLLLCHSIAWSISLTSCAAFSVRVFVSPLPKTSILVDVGDTSFP